MELIQELLAFLRTELPRLIQSGQGWSIEIHGKGGSVQVKVSGITQFQGKLKPLDEGR